MLKGLLSKSVCGECRICCGFDSTDVWEMPVMNEETKNKLEALRPGTEFVRTKNSYITKCGELSDDEIFYCPALDKKQAVFWVMKNRLTAKSGLTEL